MNSRRTLRALALVVPGSFNLMTMTSCSTADNNRPSAAPETSPRRDPLRAPANDTASRDSMPDGGQQIEPGTLIDSPGRR